MDKLIKELKRLQGDRSITRFAISMGIPPSTLSRIYSGSRGMGIGILLLILKVYPELVNTLVSESEVQSAQIEETRI